MVELIPFKDEIQVRFLMGVLIHKIMTKESILKHEAGHLLAFLKYTFITNLLEVKDIKVLTSDLKKKGNSGCFSHRNIRDLEENHLKRVLGGIASDIYFKKYKYHNVTLVASLFNGWEDDVSQCKRNGYSWKTIKKISWEMSKNITKEDEQFIEEVVALFKGNIKKRSLKQLMPVICKYFPRFEPLYKFV